MPDDSKQCRTDDDAEQDRPEPAKVTTAVDRGAGQRLAVGLDDLLPAGQRLGDNVPRPSPAYRRKSYGPCPQRREHQRQGQQDPEGASRHKRLHPALTLPYPRQRRHHRLGPASPPQPDRVPGGLDMEGARDQILAVATTRRRRRVSATDGSVRVMPRNAPAENLKQLVKLGYAQRHDSRRGGPCRGGLAGG
jgi:hypothetical protein